MSILDHIGNTPLVRLEKLERYIGISMNIHAKLEYLNPFGSIKDRAASRIIYDAAKEGYLQKNNRIIEATSGNMGVALAGICAYLGYPCTIIMPEGMSEKKQKLIRAYGAGLLLTESKKGMLCAVEKAKEIAENDLNIYYPKQFENYSSVKAHKKTTAKEIYEQANKNCDMIIAGIGTGGTISGIGRFFKSGDLKTEIIGVEPAASPFLTQGKTGAHHIEGLGAGFAPAILDRNVIDRILTVTDDEALEACRILAKTEGIVAGSSSGAVLAACLRLSRSPENKNKTAILILADSGERYL